MHAHFGCSQYVSLFTSHLDIVEVFIGDVFFGPKTMVVSFSCMLFICLKRPSQKKMMIVHLVNIGHHQEYVAVYPLPTLHCYSLLFRQIESVFTSTKDLTRLSKIRCLSVNDVSNYARVIVASNLQILIDVLSCDKMLWVFSLSNDVSTHHGLSYFDEHFCFYKNGDIHNCYNLAIPIFNHHTTSNMFLLLVKFLDAMCP